MKARRKKRLSSVPEDGLVFLGELERLRMERFRRVSPEAAKEWEASRDELRELQSNLQRCWTASTEAEVDHYAKRVRESILPVMARRLYANRLRLRFEELDVMPMRW